ncbi:MAG: hypothetical protein WBA23_09030 [Tunicatimonas sp.]|uniref:hypothetical protein n=1 Tax=Tunicatimonas sp. TaxID=1940096 RepID=UPI003C766DAA
MTTQINTPNTLLIDTEFAAIPYSKTTLQLNKQLGMQRNTTPFTEIGAGRFRRLFDRHVTAFRRR